MLDATVKRLAQGKNFATLATLLPGGQPITHVVWVDADDEHLLVNTETHRQKFKNIKRDPRVSLAIIDEDDAYSYAEVRGKVVGTVTGAEAREHIDKVSEKYTGGPYSNPIQSERVIIQIEPEKTQTNA